MLQQSAAAEQAVKAAVDFLCAADPAQLPLGIVNDRYLGSQILAGVAQRGGPIGTRLLTASEIASLPPASTRQGMAALASLDQNLSMRAAARRCVLLARICASLRQTSIPSPMLVAALFRDTLAEAVQEGVAIDCSAALAQLPETAKDLFAAELGTLQQLWDVYCAPTHDEQCSRLDRLAADSPAPALSIDWLEPSAHVRNFLDKTAQAGQPACRIDITPSEPVQQLLDLWQGKAGRGAGAPVQAYHADTLEKAALTAHQSILAWHSEGVEKIGIVAFDRLLVRRLHSLCLQDRIQIIDRTGWLASNLLVGDVLLELASSPADRKVERVMQLLCRSTKLDWGAVARGTKSGRQEIGELAPWLESFTKELGYAAQMQPARWFEWLSRAADGLAAEDSPLAEFLSNDIAGDKLRSQLNILAAEFAQQDDPELVFGSGELLVLLKDIIESLNVVTKDVKSDLQIVNPAALSGQPFDALLMLGADARTLPRRSPNRLFSDQIRAALGLATSEQRNRQRALAAAGFLANHGCCKAIWHGNTGISPFLELVEPELVPVPKRPAVTSAQTVSAHSATLASLPAQISPSSCDQLMDCPYAFYSRHALGLKRDRDERRFNYADFGNYIHDVVARFHDAALADLDGDFASMLEAATTAARTESNYFSWLFERMWFPYIRPYARLMRSTIDNGHTIDSSEQLIERDLEIGDRTITVQGKYDRLDDSDKTYTGAPKRRVVDLKTGQIDKGAYRLEKPQLAVYSWLTQTSPQAAAIWNLQRKKGEYEVVEITPYDESADLPAIGFEHVEAILRQIAASAPLPANGSQNTCRHCDYAGLCRKSHWASK